MLHFPTRPGRVALLRELGVRAISLDVVKNDLGLRLVENIESVGWNGVGAAFRELAKLHRRFDQPGRRPIRVTVMGSGAVGGHAAHAAVRYGDPALRQRLAVNRVPGVEVVIIDHELTSDENYMLSRFEHTDLLIDATQRSNPCRPIISAKTGRTERRRERRAHRISMLIQPGAAQRSNQGPHLHFRSTPGLHS
jgi:alanine dehydrogenase